MNKNIFVTLASLLIVNILFSQQTQVTPEVNVIKNEIQWLDIEEAVKLHEKTPKVIMIDMYTDWCGWCGKMDKETFTNQEIVNYINMNFYPVKFDAERTDTIIYRGVEYVNPLVGRRPSHGLAKHLMNGRMSYPTIVYIDKDFNVNPIPGYMSVEDIMPILVYFAERINYSCDYDSYRKAFKDVFSPDSTVNKVGEINWYEFNEANEKVKTNPKHMMLYVGANLNTSNRLMSKATLKDPYIADFVNENFYPVEIDYATLDTLKLGENIFINEQKRENYPHQLVIALLHPNIQLPSLVFFDENFVPIYAIRGFTSPMHLEPYLEYVAKKMYVDKVDFQKFKNEFKSKMNN